MNFDFEIIKLAARTNIEELVNKWLNREDIPESVRAEMVMDLVNAFGVGCDMYQHGLEAMELTE